MSTAAHDPDWNCLGVIGLGYVGLPLALTFAEAGCRVVGYDCDQRKVEELCSGGCYLRHIAAQRVAAACAGTLEVTGAVADLARCDAILICVPTPVTDDLQPDLYFIEETCRALAPHLHAGMLVVLESTTWPGTTRDVVQPLLEKGSGLRVGSDILLAYSPEREDPGNVDYYTAIIPKLIGAYDSASQQAALTVYGKAFTTLVPVSSLEVAETAKLFENVFRAVNIALVNELKTVLDPMGIDPYEVIDAAATKPFGFMPFRPGPGMGGHCIPIDPFYLAWKAKQVGSESHFIELAGRINRQMPVWVVSKIQERLVACGKLLEHSRVLVLGVAYKAEVDDTRESPGLAVLALLRAAGAAVCYHDPYVPIIPSTRAHPDLAGMSACVVCPRCADIAVLITDHVVYTDVYVAALDMPVVDTRGVLRVTAQVQRC